MALFVYLYYTIDEIIRCTELLKLTYDQFSFVVDKTSGNTFLLMNLSTYVQCTKSNQNQNQMTPKRGLPEREN